jgi:type I restriction enzyme S subunit
MNKHGDLPSGWTLAPLRELATINPPNPTNVPIDDTPVSFVPMAAVEELSGRMNPSTIRPWGDVKKGFTRFQDGDVVFAKITPSMENGKAALAANLFNGVAAGTTEFHVFRPLSGVTDRYLLHYVLQETFRRRARARMTGTAGQLRVPTQFLEEEVLPLAPTTEQQRIVEAIDSYLSRLDDAVASLERVQAKLDAYRASVLKAAVEGRLVPTEASLARAEKRDYEPAQALLARILEERRRRWEKAELAKLKAAGRTPKDDKWKANYEEPASADLSALPELPEGWCWATIGQLGFIASGQTPSGIMDCLQATGDIPWFRVGDMNTEGNESFMRNAKDWLTHPDQEKLGLHVRPAGTIIFPKRGGAIATNKKRRLSRPSAYDLNTMGVVPVGPINVYLWLWFLKLDLGSLSDGSNVPQINHGDIEPLPVQLPPLPEQERIACEVDRLISVTEGALAVVAANLGRCSRLRQAVLKWAFEGKLVGQDPSDEPADKLLARIRAERINPAPIKKSHGRRGKGAA